jgi:carbamoyltransferase
MKILSIRCGHDASITVIDDGKITYFMPEERLSRKKYDFCWFSTMRDISRNISLNIENSYDIIIINYDYDRDLNLVNDIKNYIVNYNFITYDNIIVNSDTHHELHAYCGFYNSPFDEAICIVLDGSGSFYKKNNLIYSKIHKEYKFKEIESVYLMNKKNKVVKTLFKHYTAVGNGNSFSHYYSNNLKLSTELSVGWEFQDMCESFGFHYFEAGKIMGLAQYENNLEKLPEGYNDSSWKEKVKLSSHLQEKSQRKILKIIEKYIKKTNIKNVVISGGCAENCVANYFYLKNLKDVNFYIDPISSDAGLSIGLAFKTYLENSSEKTIPKNKIPYICGIEKEQINYNLSGVENKKCTYDDIVDLIVKGNIVSIFQGNGECGKRALGNRSILFDPRIKNGKDIVNKIKKRENFRPFAGTVILEYAREWFELLSLQESAHMLFAVDVKKEKIKKIPAIVHADDTCRIQTLTKEQNEYYYNLIDCFYKRTGVPILLNTSFNLAGNPLVQTLNHAIHTLKNSDIEYLYLPEIETLVTVPNT